MTKTSREVKISREEDQRDEEVDLQKLENTWKNV